MAGTDLLDKDDLHVARGRHVGVDATVGTVSAAAAPLCLVDLHVLNDEVVGVQRLDIGVALSVLQEVQQMLDGLLREPARTVVLVVLAHCK